jgi:DNA-binding transcriptional LysR family regulator
MAELHQGVAIAREPSVRAARLEKLGAAVADFEPLPFDGDAAARYRTLVALTIAASHLIATLPRSVATTNAQFLPLNVFAPPLDAPGFPVHMVWHRRTHEQAPHRWLRQLIMDLSGEDASW